MARVVWSWHAREDLRRIVDYVRADQPAAARRLGQQITHATRRLDQFPLSGRVVPELPGLEFREIIVGNYRVIYEVAEEQVEVLAVIHGMRDLPSVFP